MALASEASALFFRGFSKPLPGLSPVSQIRRSKNEDLVTEIGERVLDAWVAEGSASGRYEESSSIVRCAQYSGNKGAQDARTSPRVVLRRGWSSHSLTSTPQSRSFLQNIQRYEWIPKMITAEQRNFGI
jgi:hypothetical protein